MPKVKRKVKSTLPLTKAIVRSLIQEVGIQELGIALNNVCAHGAIFCDVDEGDLNKLYEGIEILSGCILEAS